MTQHALQTDSQGITYSSFLLQKSGLVAIGTPTQQQWQECGRFLKHAEGNVHFWIGDWLRYGAIHFQKEYEHVIAATGYSYHTLRKDKYLAERIPPERRRPSLDVAIHHEVAPLEKDQQEMLLD